jgi:hypothetical protein
MRSFGQALYCFNDSADLTIQGLQLLFPGCKGSMIGTESLPGFRARARRSACADSLTTACLRRASKKLAEHMQVPALANG